MVRKTVILAALASAMLAGSANAATVLYNSNVISNTSTNWSNALNFTKFDSTLGTLTSIKITLSGDLFGNARAESLDNSTTTVTLNLGAVIKLTRPDNSTIVISAPGISNSFNAASFDGIIDFGGTSGASFAEISTSLVNSVTLTLAGDLALFTGIGSLAAPTTAIGNSQATGSGNLVSSFQTQAGAFGSVEYTFNAAVPEPQSWALMLVGFGAVGFAARRRRAVSVSA